MRVLTRDLALERRLYALVVSRHGDDCQNWHCVGLQHPCSVDNVQDEEEEREEENRFASSLKINSLLFIPKLYIRIDCQSCFEEQVHKSHLPGTCVLTAKLR